jgi:purine-binding chemotaxis protein CheW
MIVTKRVIDDTPFSPLQCQEPSIERGESGLFLLCRVRARWCALPLKQVIETLRPLPTAPITGAPAFVMGLAIIRGAPVPVVDLSYLLNATASEPTRLVCVKTERGCIALAVDHVQGVRSFASSSLHTLPPLLQCADAQVIAAIGMLDTELLFVMQTARLVPVDLWDALGSEVVTA